MTVFADGPTRVLRFADVLDQGAEEAEQSILDLAARLRQVEEQLWRVNASFSALHGASGACADPCFDQTQCRSAYTNLCYTALQEQMQIMYGVLLQQCIRCLRCHEVY